VIEGVLERLIGAAPRRLLEDLSRVAVALAKNDRARPEVELYLASGQVVKGRIVTVSDDRQGAVAVVQVGGNVRQPSVTFVRVDQVAAVNVVDASLLVHAPVSDAPAPSRLELQRQIAARLDGLHTKLGRAEFARPLAIKLATTSIEDDDSRRAVGALVPVLFDVLMAIVDDDMGKQAIGALESIELAADASGEVVKEPRGFSIRAPKLLTEQYTHQTLRKALEQHL
jgi:hypothetical protein